MLIHIIVSNVGLLKIILPQNVSKIFMLAYAIDEYSRLDCVGNYKYKIKHELV